MTTDNFCFHMQNRLIQMSQTGGQWYSDTPPLIFQGKRVCQSETTYLIAKLSLHRRTVVGENASESKSCSACLGTLGVLAGIDINLYVGVTAIDILFWVDCSRAQASLPCFVLLVLIVAAAQILAVKAGTSIV